MSQPAMAMSPHSEAFSSSPSGAWLFSPKRDLTVLLLPALVTVIAAALASAAGEHGTGFGWRTGQWTAQYILFNTTHVILTFLVLGAKPELLRTTPNQAKLLVGGSSAVFLFSFWLLWFGEMRSPKANLIITAGFHVVAAHHTLSQVKGLWALHGLRARSAGLPGLSELERKLQRIWVPLALVLIMLRSLAIPMTSRPGDFPLVNVGQAENGALPHGLSWVLLAVWLVFAALLSKELWAPGVAAPRRLYLTGHLAVIAIYLVWPMWGIVLASGIHGLEYAFLSGRMLQPTAQEQSPRLQGRMVWAVMLAAMLPMFVVGLIHSPFLTLADVASGGVVSRVVSGQDSFWDLALICTNAVVLAHYFADAFMYRFRIPRVRTVTLARLGMA